MVKATRPASEQAVQDETRMSPDYVRISTAAAIELGLKPGRMMRGCGCGCINLLQSYPGGCRANCTYCGLARERPGVAEESSFIRVSWPLHATDLVAEKIAEKEARSTVGRVCIAQVQDYRAYPVGMLAAREIVNDVVGGMPILVTWCSICFTGLVHDRRVDGETFRFGNEGTLFMQALVLYDSQTYSIWSQPWGTAIAGPLKGTGLTLIPYELVPYSTWVERHPDTKILIDELRPQYYPPQFTKDDFVIGVAIKEAATGFYFGPALQQGIVNEMVGDDPIVLVVDPDSLDIDVFLRNPVPRDGGGQRAAAALTFMREKDGSITDAESGSRWDLERGISIDGPMRGTILRRIPFISSFDWAWLEFHPDAELWDGLRGFGR